MRGTKAKALRRACTTDGVLAKKEYREVKRGTGSLKRFADEIIKAARSGKAVSVPDGEVATENQ